MEVLLLIGGIIITLLTTCVGTKLFSFMNLKIRSERLKKLFNNVKDVVLTTVKATSLTSVDELKIQNKFDKKNQTEVLETTKNKIIKQLSKELKEGIEDTYGNLEDYIVNQIEATIYDLKQEKMNQRRYTDGN